MSEVNNVVIPFNRLRRSAANVRTDRGTQAYKAGIEVLAASILAIHKLNGQGLLQNLVVQIVGDFGEVVAGGRRLDALCLLVERGEFPDTYPVPCQPVIEAAVTAASLTENIQRVAMHPADEFEAFMSMTEQGWTIDRIADAFGVTPLVVERRLKLRAAAPALLADFRANLLTTDQLIALCATDNHDRQVAAWSRVRDLSWGKEPSTLRRAVIETEVEAVNDLRVAFIGGVEVYEKAGGLVRRDLFASEGEGMILEDSSLLDALVDERLNEQYEELAAEGWAWTEVWRQMDWAAFDRLGKAPTVEAELSDAAKQQLVELGAEQDKVRAAIDSLECNGVEQTDDDYAELESLEDKLGELEEQAAKIEKQAVCFAPALIEHTGALVIFQHGSMRIERGLVRAADRAKVAELLEAGQRIVGGRETEPAGRKADALSDALRRSLLGYRNLAAQSVTAMNAKAAKILLVCKFIADVRGNHGVAPTDLSVTNGYGTRTYCTISDEAGQAKEAEFVALGGTLIEALPETQAELWDALAAMTEVELDTLLAYAVARSVSLSEKCDGLSAKYLEALGLDMADHFTPTACNYLGRVSKDLILEALTEAEKVGGDEDRGALLAMKKAALAKEAESRLAGTGWVPAVIRTQSAKQARGKSKKSGSKAATKKA